MTQSMRENPENHRVVMYLFKPVEVYRPMKISPTLHECLSVLTERGYQTRIDDDAPSGFIGVGIEGRILDETVVEHLKSRGWEIYQRL